MKEILQEKKIISLSEEEWAIFENIHKEIWTEAIADIVCDVFLLECSIIAVLFAIVGGVYKKAGRI